MIKLDLPYPPTVNTYWRNIGKGRTIISRAGRIYRVDVQAAVLLAGRPRVSGRLRLGVLLTMPDNRRRDIDNVLKALLDALGHAGVYADDSQIDRLSVERVGVAEPGGALVTIEELKGGGA